MFKIKKEKSGVVESGMCLKFEYQGKGFYKGVVLHNGSQISCAFLKEGEIADYRAKYDALFEYDDLCTVMEMYAVDSGDDL